MHAGAKLQKNTANALRWRRMNGRHLSHSTFWALSEGRSKASGAGFTHSAACFMRRFELIWRGLDLTTQCRRSIRLYKWTIKVGYHRSSSRYAAGESAMDKPCGEGLGSSASSLIDSKRDSKLRLNTFPTKQLVRSLLMFGPFMIKSLKLNFSS